MTRLLVDALACYRLTRLVTADEIAEPLRARWIRLAYRIEEGFPIDDRREPDVGESWQDVVEQDPQPPKLATFIVCRWCTGMWISLGVILVARRYRWWPALADALACSAAAALVAGLEE